jgi:hypothetical protein
MQKAPHLPLHVSLMSQWPDALTFSAALALLFAAAVILSTLVPWN